MWVLKGQEVFFLGKLVGKNEIGSAEALIEQKMENQW